MGRITEKSGQAKILGGCPAGEKSGQDEILEDNLILPGGCPAGQAQYFPYF